MRKVCLYCGKEVEVDIRQEKNDMENKGVKYSYIANIPYCKECGEEVYIREIDDENNSIANKKYREAEGLIQVNEIGELLLKYKIGKKPLAQLLGWGEVTILRTYYNYCMPYKTLDKKLLTPAQQLGITNKKFELKDIIYFK